jgi:hypothetical protein
MLNHLFEIILNLNNSDNTIYDKNNEWDLLGEIKSDGI